jgi:hypothetical protein
MAAAEEGQKQIRHGAENHRRAIKKHPKGTKRRKIQDGKDARRDAHGQLSDLAFLDVLRD